MPSAASAAGECERDCRAPGRVQWAPWCLAHRFGIKAIGHDEPGLLWPEGRGVEIARRQAGGHRPEEAIAMIKIIRPFAVTAQIREADLDLDQCQTAGCIDSKDVGPTAPGKRHFGERAYTGAQHVSCRKIMRHRASLSEH